MQGEIKMMTILNSVLIISSLFVLSSEGRPSFDPRDHRLLGNIDLLETSGERFDEWKPDSLENDQLRGILILPSAQNGPFIKGSKGNGDQFLNDDDINKRAASKGRYNYYRCYFNPVTCYRK